MESNWVTFLILGGSTCLFLAGLILFSLSSRRQSPSSNDTLTLSLRELEGRMKAVETEWEDMYEKFSRMVGRMDRRQRGNGAVFRGETPQNSPDELLWNTLMRQHGERGS